jgi:hypothetical protein
MEKELVLAEDRIKKFRADLTTLETKFIVRKHIIFGTCFLLSPDSYYDLKAEVADNFQIHPSEVIMVGSAKLGFSIAKEHRYRPFCDESDIDVALLAPILFDEIWQLVYDYDQQGGYWPDAEKFKTYLFRGWIRPDKLPPINKFEIGRKWFEFFMKLSSSEKYGRVKISAGLYRSWHFLESYQSVRVTECQNELKETT